MSYQMVSSFKKSSWYLLSVLPLFFFGCATVPESAIRQSPVAESVPISESSIIKSATEWVVMDPPLRSPRVTFADSVTGEDVTKAWSQLSNKEKLNLLSNTRSEISVGKLNIDGKITYLVANATAETGTYRVIMDYTPYFVEDAIDPLTKQKIGDARIGLGLRLTANITTNKAGINLGSLMALGVAAKLEQLQGSMHVDTIGIRLNNSGMILSSTTIDETSILKALEALAIIQSKIGDEDTYLDPQVIWVKPISSAYAPVKVAEQLSQKPKI